MTNERRKEIRKRRQQKNKNRVMKWFRSLSRGKKIALIAATVLFVLFMVAVAYLSWTFSKLDTEEIKEEDIVINEIPESVGVGYTNFVLFGGDSRQGEVKRNLNTDTIIVVSLNNETKEVKLVSVYRDTLLDMTNGKIQKCNSAYSRGGATQAINMLNMNLDLDIKKYVTVDFGAVTDLVDMLGGVEVDVSTAEYKAVNNYIEETGEVAGKKAKYLTHAGVQKLDGVQATTYARIRKGVGDDYARTARQRLIIEKVVAKAINTNLATITKIIDTIFPQIATNFTMSEMVSYAADFKQYKIAETTGFPFVKGSGTIPGRGSSVFPITLKSNVSQLHEFLYGTEGYQPSSKVSQISNEIAHIVGNRKADPTGDPSIGSNGETSNPGVTTPNAPTHTHEFVVTEKEKATCTKPGIAIYTCACGHTEEREIAKTEHQWVQVGEPVPPTDENQGYTNYTCSQCGETKKDDFVDKLGGDNPDQGDDDQGGDNQNQGGDNPTQGGDNPTQGNDNQNQGIGGQGNPGQ